MALKAYIRKEFKSSWEGRAPLTPEGVRALVSQGIPIWVESAENRIFDDAVYQEAGANLVDHTGQDAEIVLGIKEPHIDSILPGQVHLAFSHTIKGQNYNMPLLQKFLDQGATLIDYETIKDSNGVRLIAFGRYAGIAGAVDTFAVAGKKLARKNRDSVLRNIQMTHVYGSIAKLRQALEVLEPCEEDEPIRVLIVGSGNVGRGCEEVCQWLGLSKVEPQALLADQPPAGSWYCMAKTTDIVRSKDGSPFDRKDYRKYGVEKYESTFESFLGKFDILLQTPYWEEKYPRQLTQEQMITNFDRLPYAIGDISCDINGSLACTLQESSIDNPAFTYLPSENRVVDGAFWDGPSIMAIGHLPCELSVDASGHFSRILLKFMPEIVEMDLNQPLEACGLSPELQRATIVYKGELTPAYAYLKKFLS